MRQAREAGEVEERDGGLHRRALRDVARVRQHLLGASDAVVVDRPAHVMARQPFGEGGQAPGRLRPRQEDPVVDLLGRDAGELGTHLLGHLGVRLEGCHGGSTTGLAELPEDPQREVGLAGRIDEGRPAPR